MCMFVRCGSLSSLHGFGLMVNWTGGAGGLCLWNKSERACLFRALVLVAVWPTM